MRTSIREATRSRAFYQYTIRREKKKYIYQQQFNFIRMSAVTPINILSKAIKCHYTLRLSYRHRRFFRIYINVAPEYPIPNKTATISMRRVSLIDHILLSRIRFRLFSRLEAGCVAERGMAKMHANVYKKDCEKGDVKNAACVFVHVYSIRKDFLPFVANRTYCRRGQR